MHKRIIAFKIVEYPHNAQTIFNAIINIVKEYKCESKIRSFTFDNAIINKVVIDKLHRDFNPILVVIYFIFDVYVIFLI